MHALVANSHVHVLSLSLGEGPESLGTMLHVLYVGSSRA